MRGGGASDRTFVYDVASCYGELGMRYLILSDIHANLTALDTALEAAKGQWDKTVCLGDLVGYGPDPNEVIDRVRALGALTIRGNHDKAVSGQADPEEFNPMARNAVLWTRERLRAENLEYIEKLPKGPVAEGGFNMVHGAFHDEDEYVFAPEQALDGLLSAPTPAVFFGHTHIQGGFTLRGEDIGVLRFKPTTGQPRDGDPRAAFAIADMEKQSVEFWRIPYDIENVQKRMAENGLPEPLILRLSFGR